MRLIDADELEEILNEEYEENKSIPRLLLITFAKQIIGDAPSIDAEPIRHGKWIDDRVAFYKQCSECGAYVRANLYEVFLDCDIRDLRYCPHCGAKMDGGE